MANNLFDYYQGQGQSLPSVQQRQGVAGQAGIQNYTGSEQQNVQLLGYLQGLPKPPKTTTKPVVTYDSKLSKQNNTIQQQGMNSLDQAIDQHALNKQMKPQTYEGQLNQIQGQQEDAYTQWNNAMTQIANGTFPLSRYEKQQIQSTQKQFDELKQLQVTANKGYEALQKQAQFRQGTNITDPTQFLALNQQVIDQDIKKVGTIDNEANKAVAELKQSFLDKDYKMINDQYSKLSDLLKSKTDTIDKIQTRADKMANDLRDYNLQVAKFQLDKQKSELEIKKLTQEAGLTETTVKGVKPELKPLVDLLATYKNFLTTHTYGETLSPNNAALKASFLSQIAAEYKNAKKLGTLDAGVQKLVDGLVGISGAAKFNNKAQANAVNNYLESSGYFEEELAPAQDRLKTLYSSATPQKQSEIDAVISQNPQLSPEDILQIFG